MIDAFSGATALGALAIACFFLRFWLDSRDRFHLWFAASFVLLALQRAMLVGQESAGEANPLLYLPRAGAYVLIVIAVVRKNIESSR